uniref:CSON015178 protein n=1 Tax=Culicoides sonorensis TaxID=179676 RepID=A0A336LNX8_CULSO
MNSSTMSEGPKGSNSDRKVIKQRKKRIGQWSELDLIEEIRQNQILYDKTLKDYRKPGPTEAAWERISRNLGANIEDCKKRWKSLRDTFIKYYRMELEQASPLNSRQKVWKFYDKLDYLRNHVELFRLDESSSAVKSNQNDDQSQDHTEFDRVHEKKTMVRHDYMNTSRQGKTSTIKVLVEGNGDDQAEYTVYETNQDGDLEENDQENNEQIYLEPIETEDYQIENESESEATKKKDLKNFEIISSFSNDPDEKFLMSCLPVLKRLSARKNALLKLKIQTLLFEIEFGAEDDSPDIKKRRL